MATIQELRQKYPQYNDMSDQEFADRFHNKFYSDMPKEQFYQKIGMTPGIQPGGQGAPQDQGQPQQPPAPDKEALKRHLEDIIGMNRTPLNTLQDLGAGALRGGQNLAALLGEGGQAIASLLTGGRAPRVDIREELGLGKDRPVDLSQVLASKNPNPLAVAAGQFAPGVMAGGASIPGQIASNALWSGIQAQPGQKNALGFLPSGRVGAAIEGGAVGALPLVAKPVIAAAKGLVNLPKAFTKINPKEIASAVQQSHDVLENSAVKLFDKVESEVVQRGSGVSTIPVNPTIISDIEKYLPKTRASKDLIDKLKTGDYSAVRKAQSELWHRGNSKKSSILPSDRDIGEEMLDLRDQLNQGVEQHFKRTGNDDLNKILNNAKDLYKNLKETYYSHPTIGKLVGRETRKVPKNIMSVLSEDSKPMARVRKETHPIVSKKVKAYEDKKRAQGTLKNLGIASMIGSPIGLGALLYKNVFGK